MFKSEYAFDVFQQTQAAKVQYLCLEEKLEHSVYKHCDACRLFSLVRSGQSEVHINVLFL